MGKTEIIIPNDIIGKPNPVTIRLKKRVSVEL